MANKFYEHCEGCINGSKVLYDSHDCDNCVCKHSDGKPSNYRSYSVPAKGTVCHDHDFVPHIHKSHKFEWRCEDCTNQGDDECDECHLKRNKLRPTHFSRDTAYHEHVIAPDIFNGRARKEFVAYKVKPIKVEVNTVDEDVVIHDYLEMLSQIMKVAKELGIETEPDVYVRVGKHRKNKFN